MKLIVGLGNPGKEYEDTRHNVGFWVIDNLKLTIDNLVIRIGSERSERHKLGNWGGIDKFKSDIIKTSFEGQEVILAKPTTFMNESGEAVASIVNFYKIDPANVLVIHDDLDIPLGLNHLQLGHGPRGHNGILDIEEKLGTKNFLRLRVGVENRGRVLRSEQQTTNNKQQEVFTVESPYMAAKAPQTPGLGDGIYAVSTNNFGIDGQGYVLSKFTKEEKAIIEKETPEILDKIRGWITS